MPPKKGEPIDPETAKLADLFRSALAFTQPKALESIKNQKASRLLQRAIEQHGLEQQPLDTKAGSLLGSAAVSLASASLDEDDEASSLVVRMVLDGRLNTTDRINAATKSLAAASPTARSSEKQLEMECGVGVTITAEQIREQIQTLAPSLPPQSESVAGWASQSTLMNAMRSQPSMRWANALDIKNEVEAALEARYGPRSKAKAEKAKADEAAKKAAKPTPAAAAAKPAESPADADPDAMFKEGFLSRLHKPGENPQIKPELRQQHLKATGGKVFTRFPPEPNGFLHIGHSKAIAIDFGYARIHGGLCYLRYDDTNPEAEEEQYFEAILEMVRWLGFEPWKITYSSDYFARLYELAVELIRRGKAYVDHSTGEEIKAERGGEERGERKESRWRNRPVEESLREFAAMRDGKYRPGEATLRMKQDILGSGNPHMWDTIAYRVLDAPHHRTGATWRIYPTYDFTHCLVDSMENISHSLCTTEFILARESYEWLCDALEVYKPRQYEFGRLNLEGAITSKRKILAMVSKGLVQGWDDPRLFTLLAQRRRGVPPGAILAFVNSLGVSTALSSIQIARYEQTIRQYLESTTPRLFMVLRPLRVVLENVPDDFRVEAEKPLHPKVPQLGKSRLALTKVVYIDGSDFRTVDSPDYYRLAPGKTVGLLNTPFPVTCVSWSQSDAQGSAAITEVRCRYEDPSMGGDAKLSRAKPKAYLQWVAEDAASGSPLVIDRVQIFHPLFGDIENPAARKDYLELVQRDSLEVVEGAMVEPQGFWHVAATSLAQARAEAKARMRKADQLEEFAKDTEKPQHQLQKAEAGAEVGRHAESTTKDATSAVAPGEGAPKRTEAQLVGKEAVRFQGTRVAYFCVDGATDVACLDALSPRTAAALDALLAAGATVEDATSFEALRELLGKRPGEKLVLNRIVSLKQEKGKS